MTQKTNPSGKAISCSSWLLLSVCGSLLLSSCSSTVVVWTRDPGSDTPHTTETCGDTRIITRSDDGSPNNRSKIEQVIVKDDFFDDLAGVLTLGACSTHTVTYYNAPLPLDAGGIPHGNPALKEGK